MFAYAVCIRCKYDIYLVCRKETYLLGEVPAIVRTGKITATC